MTKIRHIGDLKDPNIPYDQSLKEARHDSIDSKVIERKRHDEIGAGTSYSSGPPAPPPLLVDIPLSGDAHATDA